jgi:hypothetical protein
MSTLFGKEQIFEQTKNDGTKIMTLPIKIIKNNTTIIKLNNKPTRINWAQPVKKTFVNYFYKRNNERCNEKKVLLENKNEINKNKSVYLKKRINQVSGKRNGPPQPVFRNKHNSFSCLNLHDNNLNSQSYSNLTNSLEFTFQRKKSLDKELNDCMSSRFYAEKSIDSIDNTKRERREMFFTPIKINPFTKELKPNGPSANKKGLTEHKIRKSSSSLNNKYQIFFDFPSRK